MFSATHGDTDVNTYIRVYDDDPRGDSRYQGVSSRWRRESETK